MTSYKEFNPYVAKNSLSMTQILSRESTTSIERDGDGDISKLIYSNGNYCEITYNESKLTTLLKFYDSNDQTLEEWTYSYDGDNNLISAVRS